LTALFVYLPGNVWSTLPPDLQLSEFMDRLTRTNTESEDYVALLASFIRYVYENDLMLFLPNPNNVYAVNKEVVFEPGRSAFVYLRDLEVTDQHWSVRGEAPYPEGRKRPVRMTRQHLGRMSP
jgi:peptide/nickel transport system substrate-binding protein